MIRKGSKNHHTTELKSTWKGLKGKTYTAENVADGKTETLTECCGIQQRGGNRENPMDSGKGQIT